MSTMFAKWICRNTPLQWCVLMLAVLFATPSNGQFTFAKWAHGSSVYMDFCGGGLPAVSGISAINVAEGCSAISNRKGEMIFYSDGKEVYNRNHQLMPNGWGLNGVNSPSQSALIVPKPGSTTRFYLFTIEGGSPPLVGVKQMAYTEVDMTLDGGLGDVIVSTKNTPVLDTPTERMAACQHANGTDYWVVSQAMNTSNYRAFLVTSAGVNPIPVVSTSPLSSNLIVGTMSFDLTGTKLACGHSGIELMDFDNATGQLSNFRTISGTGQVYGVEFSPDGTRLYGTTFFGLSQFDLTQTTTAAIAASQVSMNTLGTSYTLQLGPDEKIYVAEDDTSFGVINDPNQLGTACNFVPNAFYTPGGSYANQGLPNVPTNIIMPLASFFPIDTCWEDTTRFEHHCFPPDTLWWDFGDPASGAQNVSNDLNPEHVFTDTGTFTVTLVASYFDGMRIDTFARPVRIIRKASVALPTANNWCQGDTVNTTVTGVGPVTYAWQDGSTNSTFVVNQPDSIWVVIDNGCGPDTASLVIDTVVPFFFDLGPDSLYCSLDSVTLSPNLAPATYLWQDNSTNSTFTVNQDGTYWCAITNLCGTNSDTIDISFGSPSLPANLGADTLLCAGDTLTLTTPPNPTVSVLWSNNTTDTELSVTTPGQYTVALTNACGTITDTIQIDYTTAPQVNLGPPTPICADDTTVWTLNEPYATYSWQNGSTDSTFTATGPGQYWVTATNFCGSASDTTFLSLVPFPFVSLGGDTSICENDSATLVATFPGSTYLWFNSTTDSVTVVKEEGVFWVEVTNQCGTYQDTIDVGVDDSLNLELGPDTVVCQGDSLILSSLLSSEIQHQWQNGGGGTQFLVAIEDDYWVVVSNACGVLSDTIYVGFDQPPTPDLGPDLITCLGETLEFNVAEPRATYSWSTGATGPDVSLASTGTYSVSVTNACSTESDSITLTFEDSLTLTLGPPIDACEGSIISLDPQLNQPPALLNWNTGGQDAVLEVSNTGVYWLQAGNSCGLVSDTITVTFFDPPQVLVTGDTNLCVDAQDTLTITTDHPSWIWSTGSTDLKIIVDQPGLYWAEVENVCGPTRDSIIVKEQLLPGPVLGPDQQLCPGEVLTFNLGNEWQEVRWSNGSNQRKLTIDQPGEYRLFVEDSVGCSGTDTLTVIPCPAVWVPNAFTPGNNQLNDLFKPVGESLEGYYFEVFDRWGRTVFSSSNPEEGWDGTVQGEEAPLGRYVWQLNYVSALRREKILTGQVFLIR